MHSFTKKHEVNLLKKLITKKTAGLLAFLLTFSLVMPIIAFAAPGFSTAPANNDYSVTGQVYVSQGAYEEGVKPVLYLVYGETSEHVLNGSDLAIADVTYSHSANGSVYFNYTVAKNSYTNHGALRFSYFYDNSQIGVSDWVYRSYAPAPIIVTPPPTGGATIEVIAGADGSVSASALAAALADDKATIQISGEVAKLPASALTEDGTVTIEAPGGVSYTLPLSTIDVDALAASLGVTVANLTINIQIDTLTGSEATAVITGAASVGKVAAPVVDFKVTATGGGKTQEINNFGNTYIERSLPLNAGVDSKKAVGVIVNADGSVAPVPTEFVTVEGKQVAILKRNGNSIYTVIEVEAKSFADLNGHWAKTDVEKLASKLVINGTSATTFEPKRNITRAEVAALIVRSLGLSASGTTDKFSDVAAGKWYSGVVAAAVNAGIINGYADGTFKPDASITRRDLAAMIVRAQAYAGKKVELTDAQVTEALKGFTDAATLGGQKANVAIAVQSGLMKGQTGTMLAGLANTNRAEAATLINRLLQNVNFID